MNTRSYLSGLLSKTSFVDRVRGNPNISYLALLAPALVLLLGIFGLSFVIVIVYSFLVDAPFSPEFSFTLQNYLEFFQTSLYTAVLIDSLEIAVFVTVITVVISYPVAYLLAFSNSQHKNILILLILLPFWVNLVIRTYSWQLILGNKGLINYVLVDILGLLDEPAKLLFTRFSITVGLVHVLLPFMILPLYTSLNQIDDSLLEASKNLGANKAQTFYQITLPLSLSGVSAGATIVFVLAFGAFVVPSLLGGTSNSMIANFIAAMFTSLDDWGLGSAMAVVTSLLVLLIVYVFNRMTGLEDLYGGGD